MTERIKITISIVLPVIIQYAWSPIFISLVFFSSKLSSDTRISNDRLSTKFSISQESSFRTGYIYARSSPGGHEEVRATKHQFVSTGSIRFHPLERALRDSPTIAPTCIHRRMTKGRFGGAKGLASRNKIALRHRGTRVFDHHPRLFTKSSLNSHSEGFHCETILAQRRASNWAPSLS